jgi:hypothetical protein
MSDFPLGAPTNRPPAKGDKPIPGRPNWFRRPDGTEYYRQPTSPEEMGFAEMPE